MCKAGAESGSAEASHGRAGKADGGEPLPSVFNMQETLLLAGFSFEAYNEPTGGVEDVDARGSRTRFTSPFVKEVFDGVVEVYVKRARDLPTPDLFGTADPYVRMSFGGNTKATSVKQFTANPVWDEPLRILWREGVSNTQLSIRVLDKDMMGSDDDLGWATLDVGHLMDGSQHELEVRLGSVPNSRVKGKGSVQLSVRCHRFSRDPIQAAHDMVLKGAKLMPHGVADLFEGIVVSMSRFHMEIQRKEWEKQLWAAPHDWCEPLICFLCSFDPKGPRGRTAGSGAHWRRRGGVICTRRGALRRCASKSRAKPIRKWRCGANGGRSG